MKKIMLMIIMVLVLAGNAFAKETYEVVNVYSYDIVEGRASDGKLVILRIKNMPRMTKIRRELVARLVGKEIYVDNYGIGYIDGVTIEEYLN